MEMNALARPGKRQADERSEGDDDAKDLQPGRAFTEHEQRAEEGPHRAGGADGRGE